MEESTGKQNDSLVPSRTCGTMMYHGSEPKCQTSQKHGLAHNGEQPSPTEISKERDTAGLRVFPLVTSEHQKPRRKMEHNKYNPGAEIFERTHHVGLNWPAPMKTPVRRSSAPTSEPDSTLTSRAQNLVNSTTFAKNPPPLLRHTALLTNLNGCVSSSPNLVSDDGNHVNTLEKSRRALYNHAPHPVEKVVIQSAKNTTSFSDETFQSHLVNRNTSSVKKDIVFPRSVFDEHHPVSKNSLVSQVHHSMLKQRTSSDTGNFGRGEQHSFNSSAVGDLKPINLCRSRDPMDSQHAGEGTDMEVTEFESGKSTAEWATKDQTGEPSKHRRFLLIDNKGMPYTVLIEEPQPGNEKDQGVLPGGFGTSRSSSRSSSRIDISSAPRKMYSCPICSRVFEYLSYLQRHSITHSEHKPYVCDVCGKAFKRTSHLERHKYTHPGEKPNECQICHRSFPDTGELAYHHLLNTCERLFQCDICHFRFSERNTLVRHMRHKHPKLPPLDVSD